MEMLLLIGKILFALAVLVMLIVAPIMAIGEHERNIVKKLRREDDDSEDADTGAG